MSKRIDPVLQNNLSSIELTLSPEGRRPQGDSVSSSATLLVGATDNQVKAKKPKRRFTTRYKLDILARYEMLSIGERGAFLRSEGLHSARLSTWRKQRDRGELQSSPEKKSHRHTQQLQRENAQLKKKLAQAEAIIELQKKVSELLGTHILPLENSENN